MGHYDGQRGKALIDQSINKLKADVDKKQAKLDTLTKNVMGKLKAAMNIDKSLMQRNQAIRANLGAAMASGLSFIPLWGPAAGAIVSKCISSTTWGELGANFITSTAAFKFSGGGQWAKDHADWGTMINNPNENIYKKGSGFKLDSDGNIVPQDPVKDSSWKAKYDSGKNKDGTISTVSELDRQMAFTTGVNANIAYAASQIAKGLSSKKPLSATFGDSRTIKGGTLLLPTDYKGVAVSNVTYGALINKSMNWVDDSGVNLIFLTFYFMIKETDVGGRGNLILDSELITKDILDGAGGNPIQKMQAAINNSPRLGAYRSRITSMITSISNEKRTDLYKGFYTPVNFSNPNNEPGIQENYIKAIEAQKMNVILTKVKLLAYVSEYHSSLKGSMDEVFKTSLKQLTPESYNLLGDAFKFSEERAVGKHDWFSHDYKKITRLDKGASDHRKDFVIGVYAFHKVLEAHLGTWNLTSLPPLFFDDNLDKLVVNALVDALYTQFYITCRKWDRSGSHKVSNDIVRDNLLTVDQLESMPYIANYFKQENRARGVGYQLAHFLWVNNIFNADQLIDRQNNPIPNEFYNRINNNDLNDMNLGEIKISNTSKKIRPGEHSFRTHLNPITDEWLSNLMPDSGSIVGAGAVIAARLNEFLLRINGGLVNQVPDATIDDQVISYGQTIKDSLRNIKTDVAGISSRTGYFADSYTNFRLEKAFAIQNRPNTFTDEVLKAAITGDTHGIDAGQLGHARQFLNDQGLDQGGLENIKNRYRGMSDILYGQNDGIKNKFVEAMAAVEIGGKVSRMDGFQQADFNRSVSAAVKHMGILFQNMKLGNRIDDLRNKINATAAFALRQSFLINKKDKNAADALQIQKNQIDEQIKQLKNELSKSITDNSSDINKKIDKLEENIDNFNDSLDEKLSKSDFPTEFNKEMKSKFEYDPGSTFSGEKVIPKDKGFFS